MQGSSPEIPVLVEERLIGFALAADHHHVSEIFFCELAIDKLGLLQHFDVDEALPVLHDLEEFLDDAFADHQELKKAEENQMRPADTPEEVELFCLEIRHEAEGEDVGCGVRLESLFGHDRLFRVNGRMLHF